MIDLKTNNQNQSWDLSWWRDEYKDMSPMDAVVASINNMRVDTKKRSNQQVVSDLIQSQGNMFSSAVSNRNRATSKEEMKAAQLDAFAAIVKTAWVEWWYEDEWSWYNTTKDIIWHYVELNNSEAVNKSLVNYAYSDTNPYDFAVSMWVIQTPEEKQFLNRQKELQSLFWDNIPDWVTETYRRVLNAASWLSAWVDPLIKWERNWTTDTRSSWNDEAPIVWAIENYVYRNFWKHLWRDSEFWWWLTENEINQALYDLQDEETLQSYLPNQTKAFTSSVEWLWYWVLTNLFPEITAIFSWVSQIPLVWDVTNAVLSNIMKATWQTLTYTLWSPILWPISYNIKNEEDRLDWYEFLWWMWMWFAHESGYWDKWNRKAINKFWWWIKNTYWEWEWWNLWNKKSQNPSLWDAFKEWRKEKNALKTKEKEQKTLDKMYDKANKALVNPEVWQNKQASDAFSQLDDAAVKRINKSKQKSKAVLKEFDKISKAYENAENAIANTIEKMYWLDSAYEDPISAVMWGKEYTSNIPERFVEKWIDVMKGISEYQKEKEYIDLAEQAARDWNLTPYNILEMARSLSKQFDLWAEWREWQELSTKKAEVDAVRQWLKNMLKRELDKIPERQELWVNPLEYYDSLWSPIIWTRSNIVKLRSAWNKAKSRLNGTNLDRVLWWLGKIPLTKWGAAKEMLKSLGWQNVLDLVTKEKNLGKIISDIKDLEKKLSKNPTKEQIDSIMKDWIENHPWAAEVVETIEWEVIEPKQWERYPWRNPYLEEMFDTVEIETPKWLWENQWAWPDLQEPIISDENWYVWRRWKTTESYKWQKKWEWWTPEKWNETKTPSPEEIVEEKIQEKTEPNSRQEKANKYLERFWMTLEQWKKQLEAAWIKPEDADRLIEKLAKKNFKTSSDQPTIFDDLWDSNPK